MLTHHIDQSPLIVLLQLLPGVVIMVLTLICRRQCSCLLIQLPAHHNFLNWAGLGTAAAVRWQGSPCTVRLKSWVVRSLTHNQTGITPGHLLNWHVCYRETLLGLEHRDCCSQSQVAASWRLGMCDTPGEQSIVQVVFECSLHGCHGFWGRAGLRHLQLTCPQTGLHSCPSTLDPGRVQGHA